MSIGYSDNPKLFINELLASNASNNLDPDLSDFCDWIEIYNSEDTVVNIEGYYITDNLSDPFKFQFPNNSIIQPNDYFVVWADGEDYYPGNYHIYPEDIDIVIKANHANFKLLIFAPYVICATTACLKSHIECARTTCIRPQDLHLSIRLA